MREYAAVEQKYKAMKVFAWRKENFDKKVGKNYKKSTKTRGGGKSIVQNLYYTVQ